MYAVRILLLLLVCSSPKLFASPGYSGGYTNGGLSVWVINEKSGQVALCSFESRKSPASCAPWSAIDAAAGEFHLIEGDDLLSVWRIDRRKGFVSLCEYKEIGDRPYCTPWNSKDTD